MEFASINLAQINPIQVNNLLNEFCNFNAPYSYTVTSGSGIVINSAYQQNVFSGNYTMTAYTTSTNVLKWKAGGSEFEKYINKTGYYTLSLWLYIHNNTAQVNYGVEVFVNGNLYETLTIDTANGFNYDSWNCYSQVLQFNQSDEVDFRFTAQSNVANVYIQMDGFMLTQSNLGTGFPTIYKEADKTPIETALIIDIPSISHNGNYKVVIPMVGVTAFDIQYLQMAYTSNIIDENIMVGVPCISNNNEVSVMLHNLSGGATSIVTDAGFYIKVIK